MRSRSSADPTPTWPEDEFDRLDLETYLGSGPTGPPAPNLLPPGWTLDSAKALWRVHGAELNPGPDWWAWGEWGEPRGGL